MSENAPQKSVGQILKEARLSKNLEMEEVSRTTKIHANILKNMEADEFKSLGPVYAKSFLKIYADFLGLDKNDIIGLFENFQGQDKIARAKKLKFPMQDKMARPKKGAAFLNAFLAAARKIDFRLLGAVVLVLLLVWGMVKFVRGCRAKAPVAQDSSTSVAKAAAKPATDKTISSVPKVNEKIVLIIRAKAKCWLQVKVDSKLVFEGILARGSAETWQAKEKIELSLGNAGAVEMELNGEVLERIGRPGQSLRNVLVTRSGLSVGR